MQRISRAERRRSSRELAKRPQWETLEEFTRSRIQTWIQDLLEEEVTELLGRRKSERRDPVDAPAGYRNGHGKTRRLSMMAGTIEVSRPRVRDLEQRFESRLLPLFVRRTEQVGELLPQLYLHGLAQGDFELALRGLLGDGAPLSASSIERLRAKWQLEYAGWKSRRLDNLDVVYAWADGLYVKAGLEDSKAALLVIVGALRDGRKVVLAIESGQRESKESWARVLRDMRARGLKPWKVTMADGHLGDLVGARRNLARSRRAALLESPAHQRDRPALEKRLARSQGAAAQDSIRRDPLGLRAAAGSVRGPLSEALSEGSRDLVPRLGADGDLLPLPEGSLDASADHQPGRIAVLGGASAHRRRQALQEGRQCRGLDLEDPDDRREQIPPTQLAGTTGASLQRTTVRRWNANGGINPEAPRRLISFTHLLK